MKKASLQSLLQILFLCLSFSASGEEKGYCSGYCYVFPVCNLQAENVSGSYANSLFASVQDIIYQYLGAGQMDPSFMFGKGYAQDIVRDNPESRALELDCFLVRKEEASLLSIVIRDNKTSEVYLDVQYSSSFFDPNEMLRDFASSFPLEFKLPIPNTYEYRPKNEGFLAFNYGIMLDSVYYPLSFCGPANGDLLHDLRLQEDLPAEISAEIRRSALRYKIETYSCLGFGGIWLASFIAAFAVASADEDFNNGETLQEMWSKPAWRAVISAYVVSTVGGLGTGFAAMFDRPQGAVRMLNEWLETRN